MDVKSPLHLLLNYSCGSLLLKNTNTLLYDETGVCLLRCEQDHGFIWKVKADKRVVKL